MNLLIAGDVAFLPGIELTLASLVCSDPEVEKFEVALLNLGFDTGQGERFARDLQNKDHRFRIHVIQPDESVWQGFRPPTPPGFPHSEDRLLKGTSGNLG